MQSGDTRGEVRRITPDSFKNSMQYEHCRRRPAKCLANGGFEHARVHKWKAESTFRGFVKPLQTQRWRGFPAFLPRTGNASGGGAQYARLAVDRFDQYADMLGRRAGNDTVAEVEDVAGRRPGGDERRRAPPP